MKNILATSQFCGPCSTIKKFIDENMIDVEIKELGKDSAFFIEKQIKSVPVLFTVDGDLLSGAQTIIEYLKNYEKSKL